MKESVTRFPNLRVLAVEDYMMNQEILEAMLDEFECDFEIVDNNTEALELHEANPYDVILMDIVVPDMDGHEATKRIRSMKGEASKTPIIAVTANAMPEDKNKCLKSGMNGYLPKPLKIKDLEQALIEVLPKHAQKD